MRQLNDFELEAVCGGMSEDGIPPPRARNSDYVGGFSSAMGYTSVAMGGAASVSGGLAFIPTPASPALAAFAALTGLLAAGAGYLAIKYSPQ